MGSEDYELRRESLSSTVAARLIRELNAELSKQYPEEGANHFRLDPEEVTEGRGAFLVLYSSGKPFGCGALRRLDANTAELKRMYVSPGVRGKGLGRMILKALETEARRLRVKRLVLETGERQLEAMALYERSGFARIPRFGEYVDSPLSVCLAKDLRGE